MELDIRYFAAFAIFNIIVFIFIYRIKFNNFKGLLDALSKFSQIILCCFTIIGGTYYVSKAEYDFLKTEHSKLQNENINLEMKNNLFKKENKELQNEHDTLIKNNEQMKNQFEKVQLEVMQLKFKESDLIESNNNQLKKINEQSSALRTLFIKNFIRSLRNLYKEEFYQIILLYEQYFLFQNPNIPSLEEISYKTDLDILTSLISHFDQNDPIITNLKDIFAMNIDKFNVQQFTYNGISLGELYRLEKTNELTKKEKKLHYEHLNKFFKNFDINKSLFWIQCENDLLHLPITLKEFAELEEKTINRVFNLHKENK